MKKIIDGKFHPNYLKVKDIDKLEDWELLVAVCHWGKTMGDCRNVDEHGYGYTFETNRKLFSERKEKSLYMDNVCLDNDIDMLNPEEGLRQYADIDMNWRKLAREELKKKLH